MFRRKRDGEQLDRIERKLEAVSCEVAQVVAMVRQSAAREERLMATLDETLSAVQNETTVDQSLITLTGAIKAQLDQILAGGLTADQQAKVDAIFSGIQANIQAVSDAVTANTPAAPPAP